MFVVAVAYNHVSPFISVHKDGWDAFSAWCQHSPHKMVTVNKYSHDGIRVGYAEAEGQFGVKVWHEPLN